MSEQANPVVERMAARFRERVEKRVLGPPLIIHLETRARCNAPCQFCPASVGNDSRPDETMAESLVDKLLSELAERRYPNRLSFYNNNEPFLDRRIFDFIARARALLPLAFLEIKSNGRSVCLDDVTRALDAGLDCLHINDYSETGEPTPHVAALAAELALSRRFRGHVTPAGRQHRRVFVFRRRTDEVLNSRAGSSPNKPAPGAALQLRCFRPVEMMTISPAGRVSACSEDFHYALDLGCVGEQSLWEIWESEAYRELRLRLLAGDRACRDACARCDYPGFRQDVLDADGVLGDYLESVRPLRSKAAQWLRARFASGSSAPRR